MVIFGLAAIGAACSPRDASPSIPGVPGMSRASISTAQTAEAVGAGPAIDQPLPLAASSAWPERSIRVPWQGGGGVGRIFGFQIFNQGCSVFRQPIATILDVLRSLNSQFSKGWRQTIVR